MLSSSTFGSSCLYRLVPGLARTTCDVETRWRATGVSVSFECTECRIASQRLVNLARERLVLRCHKQASLEALPAKDALRREKSRACGSKTSLSHRLNSS